MLGLFPANAVGDDIEVYTDASRARRAHDAAQPAPAGPAPRRRARTGRWATSSRRGTPASQDHVGGFAVTAGLGSQDKVKEFKDELDDYSAILLESLADRLAEAFAERLHERVRTEFWGYADDEQLDNEALLKERYDGIRPAPGYPACPDHTEKAKLWELLDVEANDRHHAHREHGHVARRGRSAAGTSPTRSRSTSSSAGSARTRSRTTPSARA